MRRDDGYYSSDSEVLYIEQPFKDKPFVPSSKRSNGSAAVPPKPSTATTSTSSLAVPSTSTKRSSSSRKSPSPAPAPRRSASPDDSRYSVGQTPAKKRLRRSHQPDYTSAAHSTKEDALVISDSDDDSSSEEGQVKEIYIEGQDELLPTDEDEEDELSEIYGGKGKGKAAVVERKKTVLEEEDELDEEEDGKGKSQRKAERRKAREAKRAFWAGKSGTSGRMEGGRYGGMESD